MVECELRNFPESPYFHPIGVWVQGPGPGPDFIIRFLPGFEHRNKDLDSEAAIKARFKEHGKTELSEGFLEYWQSTISPYRGDRLKIMHTTKYSSKEECAKAILKRIAKAKKDTSKEGKTVTGVSLPKGPKR